MSTSPSNTNVNSTEQVTSPALWQVQDFLDENSEMDGRQINPFVFVERIFRERVKKSAIAMASLGGLLAVIVFLIGSPIYESLGLVRVVAREPKILSMDRDDSRLRLYDAFVTSELTYIQSQAVMRRAFELYQNRLKKNKKEVSVSTATNFADRFEISKKKGLIVVKAKTSNPNISYLSSNALLDAYAQLHLEQSGTRKSLRARELEIRQTELSNKLIVLNKQLLEVGEEFDFSSLSKAHLAKVTQLEEISSRLDELSNSLAEMEAKGGTLDADTGDMEIKRATLLDRAMADMVFARAKLAADRQQKMLRYRETHPKVRDLTASILVIDQAIETRRRLIATLGKTGAITGGDSSDKKQSIAELHALKRKLQIRKKEISNDAKILNGKMIDLKRINEEKSVITGMLAETRRVLDQLRLESRNSLPGTIEVLSKGSFPEKAAEDKRFPFAIMAFIAGIGIVFMSLTGFYFINGRYIYSDDLEKDLASSDLLTVLGKDDKDVSNKLRSLLSKIELSPSWNDDTATVVAFSNNSGSNPDLQFMLGSIANSNNIKTLIIDLYQAYDPKDNMGSLFGINKQQIVMPFDILGVDYIPFGKIETIHGYSVGKAKTWLDLYLNDYDLIIFNANFDNNDTSGQIAKHLSDFTITCIEQGCVKNNCPTHLKHAQNYTIFLNAVTNDPVFKQQPLFTIEQLIGGKTHVQL